MLFGQEKFPEEVLSNPRKYGLEVEQSFAISETPNFSIDTVNKIILKCGLRSSKFVNPDSWAKVKDNVEVVSVSIVFSKYPIRKKGYFMNHKLLFNRLKNLFLIDPLLNDALIEWKIILHTNCKNDIQVDSLFHGIIIEYKQEEDSILTLIETQNLKTNSNSKVDIKKIELFNDLPESIRLELENSDSLKKKELLIEYFESLLRDTTKHERTDNSIERKEHLINEFISTYGSIDDSVVFKVLDRNKQWKNALIVADWTGSMYQYGAQALLWHSLNFENSGLDYFTLFNDGDSKATVNKTIGKTGGIYFEKTDDIKKVIALYQLVMLKGYGGDGPENDIEALLKGIEKYPSHSQIILIADNNACVRDIELLKELKKPIRVIVCGYKKRSGINPQYIRIAKETGGSLHTIEDDIYNLQYEFDRRGEVKSLLNSNIKTGLTYCYCARSIYSSSYFDSKIFIDLDSALKEKKRVVNLDLSLLSLESIPRKIRKLRFLNSLNLSNNKIKRVNNSIIKSHSIEILDLSNNRISKFPYNLSKLHSLQSLDLSNNSIDTIKPLTGFDYLVHLDLSNNNIYNLPKRLKLKHLQYLYLNYNHLNKLPISIERLRELKELSLSGNSITKLSKRIGYLRKLEVLDLSDNNLSKLPRQINRLRKLKMLRLSGNNFTSEYIQYLKKVLPKAVIEFQ